MNEVEKKYEKLLSALKVIHTWATFRDGVALNAKDVANLTTKVLSYVSKEGK